MALQSTKTAKQKRLEQQLAELQERLSQQVAAFQDTSRAAQKDRFDTALAETDAFGHTYLPHYFDSPSAAFHDDLDRMTAMRRRHIFVIHGPREHAKSTRCRAALLRRILRGTLHYPLVVSEELKLAKSHLRTLEAELTANPRIEADFDVECTRRNMTEGILQVRITPHATGTSHTVRIDAVSYGSKVKGKIYLQHRPDFVLLDDFEDGVSSRNEKIGREKVEWVLQDLYPAVSDAGPILWLGNTARDTSALFLAMLECYDDEDALRSFLARGTIPGGKLPARAEDARNRPRNGSETLPDAGAQVSPAQTDADGETDGETDSEAVAAELSAYCYRATRIGPGERTIYLWPERYAPQWYATMKRTMGPARFEGEMNGCPVAIGVFFKREWFPTYTQVPAGIDWFSWCDPAFGKSKSACYKAIVVVATDSRCFFVVDAWLRQTEPVSNMLDAWHRLFDHWGPHAPGPGQLRYGKYENNFGQDDRLRRDIGDAEDRHDQPLPVSGDSNTAAKDARIESLEALASTARIQWPDAGAKQHTLFPDDVERLRRQMLAWPDGYDDGPDALESAVSRLRRRTAGGGMHYESLGKRRYAGSTRRRGRRGRR